MEVLHLRPHPAAQRGVEVAERLVEQEHQRLLYEGSTERHPLLLAARELTRLPAEQVRDVEHLGDDFDALLDLLPGAALELEAEGDVVERRHVRVEGVILEDHRHPSLVWRDAGDVLLPEMHAARIRLIQTGDQVERRALAAPGGPEQGHERASRDLQGKLVDGADLPEVAPKTVEAERGAADYRRSLQRRAGAHGERRRRQRRHPPRVG